MTLSLLCALSNPAFEIHGHRGMAGEWFENSLPAFQAAIDQQVDVVECDLYLTKDHVLIIHHDPKISPQHSSHLGGKTISSLNFEEIKEIKHIPALKDLLSMLNSDPDCKDIRLNCEIKSDPFHAEGSSPPALFAEKIVSTIKESGFSNRVYFTSFDPIVLMEVRKIDPTARLGFIYNQESLSEAKKLKFSVIDFAKSIQVEMMVLEHTLIENQNVVSDLQQLGFRVIPWTVNDPKRQRELFEMKVDGIITDYPQVLKKIVNPDTR